MSSSTTSSSFNFPHPELTAIVGMPTYLTISQLKRELFANASSVHTILGTGQHGFAVLVIGDVAYNALSAVAGTDWVVPVHPGPQPNIPNGTSAAQTGVIVGNYDRAVKTFTMNNEVENALKRQLLAAIDHTYVCSLQDPLYGYANVTTRALIEHLEANYATLDQDQLTKNVEALEEPWEPQESMEPLWLRAVYAQQVATAGNEPITDTTLLRVYRKVLADTGVFDLDLRDWDKKPAADKTWANFKLFFTAANKERAKKATAGQFQGSAFKAIGGADSPRPGTPTSRPGTPSTRTGTMSPVSEGSNPRIYYCWTHGLSNNPNHTSATCTNKGTGHQEDATILDMKGGNNTVRRQKGEKNKFRELNPRKKKDGAANNANAAAPEE